MNFVHSYATPDPRKGFWEEGDESWEFNCPVFVNCSNHPIRLWGIKQLDAARNLLGITTGYELGYFVDDYRLIDLPFPTTAPEITTSDIWDLAAKTLREIGATDDDFLHVMGEMTLTFAVVALSEAPCYASTSKRIVTDEGNIKTSVFEFVQFRKYH